MNLIYSSDGFKATKFTNTQSYSLDEITFFMDKKYVNLKLYLILKDSIGHIDVVSLRQSNSTNSNYYNYECDLSYPIKIKDGLCSISIIGIDPQDNSIKVSTSTFDILLDNILYNFKAQISLLDQFNKNAALIYNKMLSLYNGVVEISKLNSQSVGQSNKKRTKKEVNS